MKVLRLSVVLSLVATWATADVPDVDDPNRALRVALQAELPDLTQPDSAEAAQGPALAVYHQRLVKVAGDPAWAPRVRTGTIPFVRPGAPAERLGVNVFEPSAPAAGTLLFVHGYMSHAANFAYTFEFFVRRGWRVVTLDLPGHGLSTGPRADIDSFAAYGDAVQTWFTWVEQNWSGRRILLAHSLGSAACFEALRRPGASSFDRVIFCAPLLRTDWFDALRVGESAVGWWLRRAPSTFGWDGYLDGYSMPLHWFRALEAWVDSLPRQKPLALPLTVYSGDRDTVVDESWNVAQYQKLVPGAHTLWLPGKGHLFLTARKDRQVFHQRLAEDLGLTPLPQPE